MFQITMNALGLFLIIMLGYLMKRIGLLQKADGTRLSLIIMNITLPITIVLNMAHFTWQADYALLMVGAVLFTLLQIALAWPLVRKESLAGQSFGLFMGSGFNIGNFTLPFVQSFMPGGVALISMFDLGNSIMLAGGTQAVIDFLTRQQDALSPKMIFKRLIKTIPFTAYVVMLLLRVGQVNLPDSFLHMLQPIANANAFLSMFMIGLYLELKLPKKALGDVIKVLGLRLVASLLMTWIISLLHLKGLLPLILTLIAFSPVPTFGVINAVAAGSDEETVGFCSSVSFLMSLPLMTIVMLLMQ